MLSQDALPKCSLIIFRVLPFSENSLPHSPCLTTVMTSWCFDFLAFLSFILVNLSKKLKTHTATESTPLYLSAHANLIAPLRPLLVCRVCCTVHCLKPLHHCGMVEKRILCPKMRAYHKSLAILINPLDASSLVSSFKDQITCARCQKLFKISQKYVV